MDRRECRRYRAQRCALFRVVVNTGAHRGHDASRRLPARRGALNLPPRNSPLPVGTVMSDHDRCRVACGDVDMRDDPSHDPVCLGNKPAADPGDALRGEASEMFRPLGTDAGGRRALGADIHFGRRAIDCGNDRAVVSTVCGVVAVCGVGPRCRGAARRRGRAGRRLERGGGWPRRSRTEERLDDTRCDCRGGGGEGGGAQGL
jgi:hypothetical protein